MSASRSSGFLGGGVGQKFKPLLSKFFLTRLVLLLIS